MIEVLSYEPPNPEETAQWLDDIASEEGMTVEDKRHLIDTAALVHMICVDQDASLLAQGEVITQSLRAIFQLGRIAKQKEMPQ